MEGLIICLLGANGSGKDTFFEAVEESEENVVNVKFASSLYAAINNITGVNVQDHKDDKLNGKRYRNHLIEFATKCKEQFGEDIFAIKTCRTIEEVLYNGDIPIITDLRFDIELEKLKKAFPKCNIVVIRVNNLNNANLGHIECYETYYEVRGEVIPNFKKGGYPLHVDWYKYETESQSISVPLVNNAEIADWTIYNHNLEIYKKDIIALFNRIKYEHKTNN